MPRHMIVGPIQNSRGGEPQTFSARLNLLRLRRHASIFAYDKRRSYCCAPLFESSVSFDTRMLFKIDESGFFPAHAFEDFSFVSRLKLRLRKLERIKRKTNKAGAQQPDKIFPLLRARERRRSKINHRPSPRPVKVIRPSPKKNAPTGPRKKKNKLAP